MSGAVDVQLPFECHPTDMATRRSPLAGCSAGWGANQAPTAEVPTKPTAPRRLTVVLDMDECLLHSKFHGPNGMERRQEEARPDEIADLNSFWVTLDDGDVAQVNKRPGLDAFLEALSRDHDTVVFTAAMPDYAGPVLDRIDPTGKLLRRRFYRDSCRQVKGAFLKDLAGLVANNGDLSRVVLVDNNPLSFICQPSNGILVTSFYDEASDTALASVLQLIRHLEAVQDVRPVLRDMFRLDTLLSDYRAALFDGMDDPTSPESDNDPAAAKAPSAAALPVAAVPTGENAAADACMNVGSSENSHCGNDNEAQQQQQQHEEQPGLPLEDDDEEEAESVGPVEEDLDDDFSAANGTGCSGVSSCFGGDSDAEDTVMSMVVDGDFSN